MGIFQARVLEWAAISFSRGSSQPRDGPRVSCIADRRDVSKITIDMELFKLFTKGFVEEVASALTKEEIHYLPLGAKVMTCELALRFLTDYINGDEYFKINSPDHNLVRARAQMKLHYRPFSF